MDKEQKRKIRIQLGDMLDANCKGCEKSQHIHANRRTVWCAKNCDVSKEMQRLSKLLEKTTEPQPQRQVVAKEPTLQKKQKLQNPSKASTETPSIINQLEFPKVPEVVTKTKKEERTMNKTAAQVQQIEQHLTPEQYKERKAAKESDEKIYKSLDVTVTAFTEWKKKHNLIGVSLPPTPQFKKAEEHRADTVIQNAHDVRFDTEQRTNEQDEPLVTLKPEYQPEEAKQEETVKDDIIRRLKQDVEMYKLRTEQAERRAADAEKLLDEYRDKNEILAHQVEPLTAEVEMLRLQLAEERVNVAIKEDELAHEHLTIGYMQETIDSLNKSIETLKTVHSHREFELSKLIDDLRIQLADAQLNKTNEQVVSLPEAMKAFLSGDTAVISGTDNVQNFMEALSLIGVDKPTIERMAVRPA